MFITSYAEQNKPDELKINFDMAYRGKTEFMATFRHLPCMLFNIV